MRAQSHLPIKKQRLGTVAMTRSGRQDSNLRPSAPKGLGFRGEESSRTTAITYL